MNDMTPFTRLKAWETEQEVRWCPSHRWQSVGAECNGAEGIQIDEQESSYPMAISD